MVHDKLLFEGYTFNPDPDQPGWWLWHGPHGSCELSFQSRDKAIEAAWSDLLARRCNLRLTLDVTYENGQTSIDWLVGQLNALVSYATAQGPLTGDSDAEVDSFTHYVEVLPIPSTLHDSHIADGRLRATAPKLLEALRDMVSDRECLSDATVAFAKAAISEATGNDDDSDAQARTFAP